MNLKQLINKSAYATIGYIESKDDLDILESYIQYNLNILKEFKHIVVATNYKDLSLKADNKSLWNKYFPESIILDSEINRGHNFGTADLDNIVFDYCKENEFEWMFKTANDFIFQDNIFNVNIDESDFYYLNGISHETLYLNQFDYNKIYSEYFYPQTNSYFINVLKCDYLNDKEYLDKTYEYSKTIPNYNGKIWEYIKGWSCEDFLKNCVERNNLSKSYLLDYQTHIKLCESIKNYGIGDPSHKNIVINGICHLHYFNHNVLEI
jgi:hypothetical protein